MTHEDGGARVGVVTIQLFDGTEFGLVLLEQPDEVGLQNDQPLGDGGGVVEPDDASVDQGGSKRVVVNHAVTGEPQTRINAKNPHEDSLPIQRATGEKKIIGAEKIAKHAESAKNAKGRTRVRGEP